MKVKRIKPALIILAMLAVSLFSMFTGPRIIEAKNGEKVPDAVLKVSGCPNGEFIFQSDEKLEEESWYPGKTECGILRIYNNYKGNVKVKRLGLSMRLERLEGGLYRQVTDTRLYEAFGKAMKLTVRSSHPFSHIIYGGSFYGMLYENKDESFQGYVLDKSDRFSIKKNKYADFEYTVSMDEDAGNELQGLRATVSFVINVYEGPED